MILSGCHGDVRRAEPEPGAVAAIFFYCRGGDRGKLLNFPVRLERGGRMSYICGRAALQMEAEQNHMTEMIFDLALEIIYFLTGEKHAAVKMTSIEGLMQDVYPPMSRGGGPSQTPTMKPPSYSRIPESNNQKVLEVTSKIIELLAGEVNDAGNSSPVCAFMEERRNVENDHFLDAVMEDHPPIKLLGGSRRVSPSERCPRPLYSWDSANENREILHHDPVINKMMKKDKEEGEKLDLRGDERFIEEEISPELPMGTAQEGYSAPHHYQEENLVGIKQEEEHVRSADRCKEEEISPQISSDWRHARDIQEQPPYIVSNAGIQNDDDIASDFSDVISPNLHSVHTQEKTFSCTEYAICFSEKASLIKHKQVHIGEKPYSCSECGRTFSHKSVLIRHEQVHTGEKPYSCSICGRCFSHKSVLIRHERVHTGEKPYSCFECGKCFSQKFSSIIHKRVHTGEKPYSCSDCGKCFTNKSSLLKHEQVHTGQNPY